MTTFNIYWSSRARAVAGYGEFCVAMENDGGKKHLFSWFTAAQAAVYAFNYVIKWKVKPGEEVAFLFKAPSAGQDFTDEEQAQFLASYDNCKTDRPRKAAA